MSDIPKPEVLKKQIDTTFSVIAEPAIENGLLLSQRFAFVEVSVSNILPVGNFQMTRAAWNR